MSRLTRVLILVVATTALLPSAAQSQIEKAEYEARRDALLERIDDGVVVAFGGVLPVRHWPPFFQRPAFRYLTGFLESDAVLVMTKEAGQTDSYLFVQDADPRRALYDGERSTPETIQRDLGLTPRRAQELDSVLDAAVDRGLPVYSILDFQSNEFSRRDSLTAGRMFMRRLQDRHEGLEVREINRWVDELRAVKSPAEVDLLTQAIDISSRAHEAAMRAIEPGMGEHEVQAIMESEYRRLGADMPGYSSIVGSGPNSTVLHYPAGKRTLRAGEVVLMDVAAYYEGYSADITRTVPVDPTFSPELREAYTVVLNAQKAAESVIEEGTSYRQASDAASEVLHQGLVDLGLIESVEASFDAPPGLCPGGWAQGDGCPQWYLYVYHGFIHGIGLDVHDPSTFSTTGAFHPGDVFTIEPGLYVRGDVFDDLPDTPKNRRLIAHARDAVERYKHLGIRIEDNYWLSERGLRRLSDVPREIAEIEALRGRPVS